MGVERSYKFRIYPNPEQEILIRKTFGCESVSPVRTLTTIFLPRESSSMMRQESQLHIISKAKNSPP